MKRSKQDKQFMIQLDQANRDAITAMSMFILSMVVSVTALLASAFAIVFSVVGFGIYSIVILVAFLLILAPFWIKFTREYKKALMRSKNLNAQISKTLLEIYPEYKEKLH